MDIYSLPQKKTIDYDEDTPKNRVKVLELTR